MVKQEVYNWRSYLGLKLWQKVIITFIVFSFLSYFVNIRFDLSSVLSASTFLFSILLGFFMASAMNNFSRLKTLIAAETGGLIALHRLVKAIDPLLGEKAAEAIDKYIVKRFDYELENYIENTNDEFYSVFDVLRLEKILPEDKREENALYFVFNSLAGLPAVRNEIAIVGKSTLNRFYWYFLYLLGGTVIISLFLSAGTTLSSKLATVILSTLVILSLLLLDEIDKNKLNEEDVAFLNYNKALKAIGRTEYYLDLDIKAGRVKAPENEEYRLAHYKNFPYSFEKEIRTIKPS